mgnify:CR=1 FL=1
MKVISYVVAYDYGFAPNPFHGFLTLATCKPQIRRSKNTKVGDILLGKKSKQNKLIYVGIISETGVSSFMANTAFAVSDILVAWPSHRL